MFKYRIVQTDNREYEVLSDLPSRSMIAQEKKAGKLKELFLLEGTAEAGEKDPSIGWKKVYPASYY
jgi:hypothetical protein